MSSLPLIGDFFAYSFLGQALVAMIFISLMGGLISPIIVAKRYAFMGSAVSHSTLLGLAIALSLLSADQEFAIFNTTLFVTLIPVGFLAFASYRKNIPNDALIGIFFSTTFALGVIIYGLYAQGKGDLLSYLFGNLLLIGQIDLLLAGIMCVLTFLAILIPYQRWVATIYDEESALVDGIHPAPLHYALYLLMTLIIISSIKMAGAVLINTLLLVPGVYALKVASNMRQTFFYSTLFSLGASLLGLIVANELSWPVGAALAVVHFSLLVLFLTAHKIKENI